MFDYSGVMIAIWIVLAIALVLVAALVGTLYVVPQQKAYIIERLGKFSHFSLAGFHVKIPIIDSVVSKVDLRTNQLNFNIDAKTKDNVTIGLEIAAQYRVCGNNGSAPTESGIWRSYYMLVNPKEQLESYLADALRSAVPRYTLDQVFDKKDAIALDVNKAVSALMADYGFDVVSTLILNIRLPKDVEQSMNSINSAQRDKAAAQSLAEAEKIRITTEAQAQAEAMQKAGEGIAMQRRAIADGIADSLDIIQQSGISANEANMLFAFTQWSDMMGEFAKAGKATTVVLPSDFRETSTMFENMLVANNVSGCGKAKK